MSSPWPLSRRWALVVFWLLYDAICRAFGQKQERRRHRRRHGAGAGVHRRLPGLPHLCGPAAFLLMGAMIATSMSANVFFWIIPGQRKVVALKAGQPVDPIHGKRGKQRSVHNTYFTLPVLFAMLSNHYSFTYSHPQTGWC
jgi:uncharacterized membrane protein